MRSSSTGAFTMTNGPVTQLVAAAFSPRSPVIRPELGSSGLWLSLVLTLAAAFLQTWLDIRRVCSVNPATLKMIQIGGKIIR